jgi:hypothetical protein
VELQNCNCITWFFFTFLRVAKSLGYKPDQSGARVLRALFIVGQMRSDTLRHHHNE